MNTTPPNDPALSAPSLSLLARLRVEVDKPIEIGAMTQGQRRIISIIGGTIEGPRMQGKVLAVGADFQMVQADGVATLDARYALEMQDGTRIFVMNRAMRRATPEVTAQLMRGEPVDPQLVYFRCQPTFEAPPGPWDWLNRSLFVGTGVRRPTCVELAFFELQ